MKDFLVLACMYVGAVFMVLAAVGLLRFPDVYSRTHAASTGGTMGLAGIFAAVAIFFGELGAAMQTMLVIAFVFLTAPVGTHMIARAAYRTGVPLWGRSVTDALRGRYDTDTGELSSAPPPAQEHASDPAGKTGRPQAESGP